jgi:RNA polymerase sigma factor (TIGR02999 family)
MMLIRSPAALAGPLLHWPRVEQLRMPVDNPQPQDNITGLLQLWRDGDDDAFNRVMPLVYDQLHRMALGYLAGERASISLDATGLVNEVCLRLLGWDAAHWQNRGHFFGVSAQMMRHVLVDIARRRRAERRGGEQVVRLSIDDVDVASPERHPDVLDIDRALQRLEAVDARKARVVELRYFGGLSVDETAEALQVSVRTVHKDWAFARAWLFRAMKADG